MCINIQSASLFLCMGLNTHFIIASISGLGFFQKLSELLQKCSGSTLAGFEMKTIRKIVHVCSLSENTVYPSVTALSAHSRRTSIVSVTSSTSPRATSVTSVVTSCTLSSPSGSWSKIRARRSRGRGWPGRWSGRGREVMGPVRHTIGAWVLLLRILKRGVKKRLEMKKKRRRKRFVVEEGSCPS